MADGIRLITQKFISSQEHTEARISIKLEIMQVYNAISYTDGPLIELKIKRKSLGSKACMRKIAASFLLKLFLNGNK